MDFILMIYNTFTKSKVVKNEYIFVNKTYNKIWDAIIMEIFMVNFG
jgi:hypothetical protein